MAWQRTRRGENAVRAHDPQGQHLGVCETQGRRYWAKAVDGHSVDPHTCTMHTNLRGGQVIVVADLVASATQQTDALCSAVAEKQFEGRTQGW